MAADRDWENLKMANAEAEYVQGMNLWSLRGIYTRKVTSQKTLAKMPTIRKDCLHNKSKFYTEDHFAKHMNITICWLNLNEIIYKR